VPREGGENSRLEFGELSVVEVSVFSMRVRLVKVNIMQYMGLKPEWTYVGSMP
jgi:hypothetical protein